MTRPGARDPDFVRRLSARIRGGVTSEPLARLSTYRIGGPATVVVPADVEDLAAVLGLAAAEGVPIFVLGLGSNVLLPDEGLDALVVRIGKGLDAVSHQDNRWRLGAGLPAPLAARRTAAAGWAGLHMMVGVPGSVGGGVYMNAGCHGGQWSGVARRVAVLDRAGEASELAAADLPFGYRRSGLGPRIVTSVEVELEPGGPDDLTREVKRLFDWRARGTPFNQPCCGSVFKNPREPVSPPGRPRRTAGQLIEACGFKGARSGAIEVSPRHANYFVNTGEGTAADVRRLMERVQAGVRERFGVILEPEVQVIGPAGERLDGEA